jgi:myo-inositol-1(or 4)-monophosphatase
LGARQRDTPEGAGTAEGGTSTASDSTGWFRPGGFDHRVIATVPELPGTPVLSRGRLPPGGAYPAGMAITDVEIALAAARSGATVVRSMYGTSLARFEKTAGDFATEADLEAERTILDIIRDARPDDAVSGEESGLTGSGDAHRRWLVDPLCGTLNYAARTMLVAVNVALRVGADLTVAASADPFANEVFWTDGDRAYVRRDGVDIELTPSPASGLVEINLDPPFPNEPGFLAARLLADPGFTGRFRPRVLSTTLAVAWVAAGRRAAYVTDGHLRDNVHFAAGIAICRAAGCVVTGIHGEPLHEAASGLVVAADHETHAALLALIAGRSPEVTTP